MSVSLTAPLTALPTEILSLIVTQIASKSTLCNLARCSRQLYLCTIPHLYGHITIKEDGKQQDMRLVMLTASLLRRPDIAKLVRQFSLHVARPRNRIAYTWPTRDGVCATAVDPSGLTQEEIINCLGQYDHTHTSRNDFILSFLLPALLNVEKLVLDVYIHYRSHFLEEAMRKVVARKRPLDAQLPFKALTVVAQSPHPKGPARKTESIAALLKLPAIQKISGNIDRRENYWKTEFIAALLKLPAIQKISGNIDRRENYRFGDYGDACEGETFDLKELASSSSPLTSLDLATNYVSALDIRHILRAPRALKNFSFTITMNDTEGFGNRDLLHALELQKDCLETITIRHNYNRESLGEDSRLLVRRIGSFTPFTALKVVEVSGLYLTYTVRGSERNRLLDIFPPSLETLHLTRLHSEFNQLLEALECLLAYKSPRQVPSLKTLILQDIMIVYNNDLPRTRRQEIAIEKLSGVAKSQDVIFEVMEKRNC